MSRRRFVISLNSTTVEQQKAFVQYLTNQKLPYWHWLHSTWLIIDHKREYTASSWRDILQLYFPKVHCMVIQLNGEDDTWSGFGPASEENNMFNWIKDGWKSKNNHLLN